LSIFNPSVYEIPGFALRLRWGRAFNSGESTSHDDWLKSLQSKDEHFTEHLRPGRWNKIDVSLGPVQAEQLEYIIIEMEVDNIMATSDTGSHGASKHSPNFLEWTSP